MSRFARRAIIWFLFVFLCTACTCFSASLAWADPDTGAEDDESRFNRSIVEDAFLPVFKIEPGNGASILDDEASIAKREVINEEIWSGTASKRYSLYDRFGGEVRYIPYYGEMIAETGIVDRFYSWYLSGAEDVDISTLFEILTGESRTTDTAIYSGRKPLPSEDEWQSGAVDPRRATYKGADFGYSWVTNQCNYVLGTANIIVHVTGFFISNGIFDTFAGAFTELTSSFVWESLTKVVTAYLPIFICIFIVTFIGFMIRYVTAGNASLSQLVFNCLNWLISLAVVGALLVNPAAFTGLMTKIVHAIDDVFAYSLSASTTSEVVKSDSADNVMTAALWEKAIFNPWCSGMFGADYKELYTTEAGKDASATMKQSEDSAGMTGDVQVPVGNGKVVRNWAALAWSCQSIYHIDAVEDENGEMAGTEEDEETAEDAGPSWPVASRSAGSDIYHDNFRWIDAQCNIGPEMSEPRSYITHFEETAWWALYASALTLPILYAGIRRTISVIGLVFASVTVLWRSLVSVAIPSSSQYSVWNSLKRLGKPIGNYFWWSLVIYIQISLFYLLIGSSFASELLFVVIAIYLCRFKPMDITRHGRDAMRWVGTNVPPIAQGAAGAAVAAFRGSPAEPSSASGSGVGGSAESADTEETGEESSAVSTGRNPSWKDKIADWKSIYADAKEKSAEARAAGIDPKLVREDYSDPEHAAGRLASPWNASAASALSNVEEDDAASEKEEGMLVTEDGSEEDTVIQSGYDGDGSDDTGEEG